MTRSYATLMSLPVNSFFQSSIERVGAAARGVGVAAGAEPPAGADVGVAVAGAESLKKRKSVVNDELSHGICRPSVSRATATRTRLKASSIGTASCATCSSAVVYGESAPLPSSASAPGDVENEMNEPCEPARVSTIARPLPAVPAIEGNGLLRHASSM